MSTVAASVEEVREAVAGCPDGRRLLPVGAGTKPALSASERRDVDRLDVSGLRGLVEYDPAELTFTALAGTPVAEVQAALAEHGQYLPFDPPLGAAGATLGGVVAAGTSGSGALRHGGVRDFVIGVRLVDGTGRLVSGGGRVVKNAAGFDLPKLMVGSMGRLGAIVQLSFKVFPRPRATTTLWFELGSVQAAMGAAAALAGGPRELDAVDVLAEGALLVRIGGDPAALADRAARVVAAVGVQALAIDGPSEQELWLEAATLSVAADDALLVRVALTAHQAPALATAVEAVGGTIRFALAGNLAWIGWPAPAPAAELDAALTVLRLSGMVLVGDVDRALLGAPVSGAFAERVRRALDPLHRFVEL